MNDGRVSVENSLVFDIKFDFMGLVRYIGIVISRMGRLGGKMMIVSQEY